MVACQPSAEWGWQVLYDELKPGLAIEVDEMIIG